MLNSIVVDVAIGIVFGFLGVSLLTSTIVEAINSLLKTRSRILFNGIKGLLNDTGPNGLAQSLYKHLAVRPRAGEDLGKKPAYIDKAQFAAALMDITGLSTGTTNTPGPAAIQDLKLAITSKVAANDKMKTLLDGIIHRTEGDLKQIQLELGAWFDTAMDRLSGDFKRWTQLVGFGIALAIAIIFNIDTLQLGNQLWKHPTIVDHLKLPTNLPSPSKPVDNPIVAAEESQEKAASLVSTYLDSGLPIGWPSGNVLKIANPDQEAKPEDKFKVFWEFKGGWQRFWAGIFAAFPGCFITAIATLFGAPFWFDMLQSFVRLKGSGPSPAEKEQRRGAAA